MTSPQDLDKISPWNVKQAFETDENKSREKLKKEDLEYMQDISEALLAQATPGTTALLYLMAILTVIALVWAGLSKVDEVTQAQARVIPSNREQIISSLEGGLLGELLVKEGDLVEKGQQLLQLEPTRMESQYREGVSRELALKAARARARAEAFGIPLEFPLEVKANQELLKTENESYIARKRMLEDGTESLKKSQRLLANEIEVSEKLASAGLLSVVELSRLQRQANDVAQQIQDRNNRFKSDANTELSRIESELSQLKPNIGARLDSLRRTVLKAPVKGIVKNIRMTTVGSSVPPSAPILDIVPVEDTLVFEAKLAPAEISHVHPGLPVTLKLAAYDSSKYGDLEGTVELVSPDTFRDDPRPAEGMEAGYYRVLIRASLDPKNPKHKEMQIIPGMTATAQIRTGEKTVLEYLLKPLLKAKDAFRER